MFKEGGRSTMAPSIHATLGRGGVVFLSVREHFRCHRAAKERRRTNGCNVTTQFSFSPSRPWTSLDKHTSVRSFSLVGTEILAPLHPFDEKRLRPRDHLVARTRLRLQSFFISSTVTSSRKKNRVTFDLREIFARRLRAIVSAGRMK